MKILFYGDSITDCGRSRDANVSNASFGSGYVMQTVGRLYERDMQKYECINRGISGNRIVDLYARIKMDVWNHKPDVLSIMIGINDIWHELGGRCNGVELDRFEKIYRMLIEDTLKVLPDVKIILCEPFVLKGSATEAEYDRFCEVYDYAKCVKALADEFGLYFLPLQSVLTEAGELYGNSTLLGDGVHPTVKGSVLIAGEWLKVFDKVEADLEN